MISNVVWMSAAQESTVRDSTVRDSALRDSTPQDSSAQVPAPAAPRIGPPDTSYHMKLGYTVAGVIFLAYIVLLMRRVATVRRAP